jgi:hypothetical protein
VTHEEWDRQLAGEDGAILRQKLRHVRTANKELSRADDLGGLFTDSIENLARRSDDLVMAMDLALTRKRQMEQP